jgi:transcriptional regulator with PAS, ATPase and Fis domain
MALAKKVAGSPCTVLITGESGTGKELVARIIHDTSPFHSGQYIPINVAALPSELVESQLFGHVRGAFTGANHNRPGAFMAANHGTLLLDEIGDLPLQTQPKLLRALEQKEILPVGSDSPIPVDTRVVAATSWNLEELADTGRFRADLLYRINVVQIEIPPLRERPEDISVLAEYYCEKFCHEAGKPPMHISHAARQQLLNYAWKGNVRELAHILERAVLLCDSDEIGSQDLPADMGACAPPAEPDFHQAVESFKHRHIVSILEDAEGDRHKAAEMLGISPATLFRYIDKYHLKGYALKKNGRLH